MSIRNLRSATGQAWQAGISLIELVLFIAIVGIGLAGILSALDIGNRASSDPLLRKQALAIAEALLEEIQLQPFTWCDPDDPKAVTAVSAADCTGGTGGANDQALLPLGTQASNAGESRYSATLPFDNVSDYAALGSMSGIRAIYDGGNVIAGLENYQAAVTITPQSIGGVPEQASLRIDVRVTHGSQADVTLTGYRLRYAPNATP